MYYKAVLNDDEKRCVTIMDELLLRQVLRLLEKGLKETEFSLGIILSASRQKETVKLRHTLVYYLHNDLKLNKSEIGRLMKLHHTSVMHAAGSGSYWMKFYKDRTAVYFLNTLQSLNLTYLINLF